MDLLSIYGFLALGVMAVSLAAKTNTLWRLGVLFFISWLSITFINFNTPYPVDATGFASVYAATTFLTAKQYLSTSCMVSLKVASLQAVSFLSSLYYLHTDDYYSSVVASNFAFCLTAAVIIIDSLKRLYSDARVISRRNKHIRHSKTGGSNNKKHLADNKRIRPRRV